MTNTMRKDSKYYATKNLIGKILIYGGLILYAIWILLPFAIVLITSFKTNVDAAKLEFSFFPEKWTIQSYIEALRFPNDLEGPMIDTPLMLSGLINTLLYVIPPTVLGLFASALAAFAFSKLKFKGSNGLFGLLLSTMLIPGSITIVPAYVIYDQLNWTGSPLPLIIPGMFGAAACVFFLKQYFTGIPTELVEAAKLDGLGFFGIFFKIFVPLSIPALFAQGLLGFIGGYNDYFGPYIYLHEEELYTIQIVLRMFTGTYASKNASIMAGSIVAMIPTILIYLGCQKYFIEGIATSGMKL